ncbi:hypothetical protein CAPTEDRAFT_203318, partial [Capitella teleta]
MADTKTNNHIRIASYNCRGAFGASLLFINYLVSQCDVLLIQEHWGLTNQLCDLESRLDNARVYGKSGMDESQPLVGRPHGGCAVIVRKDLKCSVEPVTTMNKRLFSCLIRLPVAILGWIAFAFYEFDPLIQGRMTKGDQIVPLFLIDILGDHAGVPGLIIAAIFAAALSSVSSAVNSLAALTLEDFIKPIHLKLYKCKLSEKLATRLTIGF